MPPLRSWAEYLDALGVSNSEIARRAGIDPASISRSRSGDKPISARHAISIARAFGYSPLDALVAAGYLEPGEVSSSRTVPRTYALRDYTDLELARETVRRIAETQGHEFLLQPLDSEHPAMQGIEALQERNVGDDLDHSDDEAPTSSDDRLKDDYGAVAKSKVVEVDPHDSDV